MIFQILLFIVFVDAADPCVKMYDYACGDMYGQSIPEQLTEPPLPTKNEINAKKTIYAERFEKELTAKLKKNPKLLSKMRFNDPTKFPIVECAKPCDLIETQVKVLVQQTTMLPFARKHGISVKYDKKGTLGDWQIRNVREIKSMTETYTKEFVAEFTPSWRINYIKKHLFKKIQDSIVKILRRLPNDQEQKKMEKRISSVKLKMEICSTDLKQASASYDPKSRSVEYCLNNLVTSNSIFSEIRRIAHEMAHDIDPEQVIQPHFDKLIVCLRSKDSIEAKVRPGPDKMDQINESLADWMAAEVVADLTQSLSLSLKKMNAYNYRNGVASIFKDYCPEVPEELMKLAQEKGKLEVIKKTFLDEDDDNDEHPILSKRYELLLSQPDIRRRMSCDPKTAPQKYCDFGGNQSSEETWQNPVSQ